MSCVSEVFKNQKLDISYGFQPILGSVGLSVFSLGRPRDTPVKAQWDEGCVINWGWCLRRHLIISFMKKKGVTLNALWWLRARCSRLYRLPSPGRRGIEITASRHVPAHEPWEYGFGHSWLVTCHSFAGGHLTSTKSGLLETFINTYGPRFIRHFSHVDHLFSMALGSFLVGYFFGEHLRPSFGLGSTSVVDLGVFSWLSFVCCSYFHILLAHARLH